MTRACDAHEHGGGCSGAQVRGRCSPRRAKALHEGGGVQLAEAFGQQQQHAFLAVQNAREYSALRVRPVVPNRSSPVRSRSARRPAAARARKAKKLRAEATDKKCAELPTACELAAQHSPLVQLVRVQSPRTQVERKTRRSDVVHVHRARGCSKVFGLAY